MRATVALARAARRGGWRAPGLSRSRRVRPPRDASARRARSKISSSIRSARWPAIAAAQGVRLQHVKPHGALYNMAARDAALADAIARATAVSRSLADSVRTAGLGVDRGRHARRLRTASRGFADRAYQPDGTLVPRSEPGAVIEDRGRRGESRRRDGARSRRSIAIDGSRVAARGGHDLRARRHAGRGSARVTHSEGADRCRRQRSAGQAPRAASVRAHWFPPRARAAAPFPPSSSAAPSGTRRCAGTL